MVRVLLLEAPPGAGKNHRVPPALLGGGRNPHGSLLVIEPRRIAARFAAVRMEEERGETVGDSVGYAILQERCTSPQTCIEVVTGEIFLRCLQNDPSLEGRLRDLRRGARTPSGTAISFWICLRRRARPSARTCA